MSSITPHIHEALLKGRRNLDGQLQKVSRGHAPFAASAFPAATVVTTGDSNELASCDKKMTNCITSVHFRYALRGCSCCPPRPKFHY